MDIYDITIVGGGPVGLFGAYYAGLREMRTRIIDTLPTLGGQLATLYPEKYIYDMPGFPKVLARDLANGMAEQALQYNPTVNLGETVESLASDGEVVTLTTDHGVYLSRTALLTAGVGAFEPKRHSAKGAAEFAGRGLEYWVADKAAYEGARVVVVGGGDSALDWTLNLSDIAESVTVVHRRDEFRAHERTVLQCKAAPNVTFRLFEELKEVHGSDRVEAVTLLHNKMFSEETLPCDAVLVFLGFSADLGPIRSWGLEIVGNSVIVNERMETNIPRVYAAGDVVAHEGKLKLIATGTGEAAVAVNFAKNAIDPKSGVFPGHSSTIGAPGTPIAPDTTA